jgi:hypothetical protein
MIDVIRWVPGERNHGGTAPGLPRTAGLSLGRDQGSGLAGVPADGADAGFEAEAAHRGFQRDVVAAVARRWPHGPALSGWSSCAVTCCWPRWPSS